MEAAAAVATAAGAGREAADAGLSRRRGRWTCRAARGSLVRGARPRRCRPAEPGAGRQVPRRAPASAGIGAADAGGRQVRRWSPRGGHRREQRVAVPRGQLSRRGDCSGSWRGWRRGAVAGTAGRGRGGTVPTAATRASAARRSVAGGPAREPLHRATRLTAGRCQRSQPIRWREIGRNAVRRRSAVAVRLWLL